MGKSAKAFAPAAISSFFEICDQTPDGKPIPDLVRIGSRGGGFGLAKGVSTEVTVSPAKSNCIQVSINSKPAPEAQTTRATVEALLSKANRACKVAVKHRIEVPIGVGFGTSAGGALTAGLALTEALELPFTYNQIGAVAHAVDVQCKTGLGTVTPLAAGGRCILVLEPGAPGIGIVDRIPISHRYVIVVGVAGASMDKSALSSRQKRTDINHWGKKTLEAILANPCAENFLSSCWLFAQKTGFATDKTRKLVALAEKAGALGAAQNMIGEAVHALVVEEKAAQVAEAFKCVLPKKSVFTSKLDSQGARLVS